MSRIILAVQETQPNSGSVDLKGQSHEKVGLMSVWRISLGPN
jgi:hypothetical protein